jgi:hypothetical protein
MSVDREVDGEGVHKEFARGSWSETGTARHAMKGKGASCPKKTSLAARIALVAGSVVFSLVVLEAGCRLVRLGPDALTHWPNFARSLLSIGEDGNAPCAYAYDKTLGWSLPTNCTSPRYNVDADGFRRTPATSSVVDPPILATGSSFALGEEVADDASWPAYLQNLIGRKVVNAAVSGYALDQTVLRTEEVAARVKPLFIVAGFTPGDIRRTEVKMAWSREKPYFAVADGRLELRNVPVPGRPDEPVSLPVAARFLGWSALADEVVKRLGIQRGWYFDEVQAVPAGTGETIACLLMPRLAAIGVPVVVLAQYGRAYWTADEEGKTRDRRVVRKVLDCASEAGLIAIDLADPMRPAIEARGVDALFRTDHHSAEGNRVAADLIMHELIRRHLLPQTAHR